MKIRRPFRALVYVAVIAAAAAYVSRSAMKQAISCQSVVGSLARWATGRQLQTQILSAEPMGAIRANKKWTVVELSAELPWSLEANVLVKVYTNRECWGIWHALMATEDVVLGFSGDSSLVDPDAEQAILHGFHQARPNVLSAELLQAQASGRPLRRILWLGVLGDLSILAAFAAIIFSIVKLRREIRWRRPGHCTECDYNLAGLNADKCPECGAALERQASPPVT